MADPLKPFSPGPAWPVQQKPLQARVIPTTTNIPGGGGGPSAAEPLGSAPGKYSPQQAPAGAVLGAAGRAGSTFQPVSAVATRAPPSLSLNSPQLAGFKLPQWLDADANGRVDLGEARVKHAELRGLRIQVEQGRIAPSPGVSVEDMRRDEATLAAVIQHLQADGAAPSAGTPPSVPLSSPQLASFKLPGWLDVDANGRADLDEARVRHAELRGQRIQVEQGRIAPSPGVTLADMKRDEAILAGLIQGLEGGIPAASAGISEATGKDPSAMEAMEAAGSSLSALIEGAFPRKPLSSEELAAEHAQKEAKAGAMARLKAIDESLEGGGRPALRTDGELADPNHWYAQVFDIKAGLEAQGGGMNQDYPEQLKKALPENLVLSPEKAKDLRDGAPAFVATDVDVSALALIGGNDVAMGKPPQSVEVRGLLDGHPTDDDSDWAHGGKAGVHNVKPSLNGTFFRLVPAPPGDQSRTNYSVPMTADEVKALRSHLEDVAGDLAAYSAKHAVDDKTRGRLGRLLSADSAFMKALREAAEHGNVPAMLR